MKKIISLMAILTLASVLTACDEGYTRGAGTGAIIGGFAGILLDRSNPWAGGVIGGALGAVAGATIVDISRRGSYQAAETGKPVEYKTDDGRGVYMAEPVASSDDTNGAGDQDGSNAQTHCKKVRERVWQDGQLVKDRVKEVCTSEEYQNRY